jgi:hypothetical protein
MLHQKDVVLMETSASTMPAQFTAWVRPHAAGDSYYDRAKSQLASVARGQTIPLAAYKLVETDLTTSRWIAGLGLGGLSLFTLGLGYLFVRRSRNHLTAPALKPLTKSVRANEGLPSLAAELDRELAASGTPAKDFKPGPLLTQNWIVNIEQANFTPIAAHDVVWITPYTFQQTKKSSIPFMKDKVVAEGEMVQVVGRDGRFVAIAARSEDVVPFMQTLHGWAPWAVVGPHDAMHAHFGLGGQKGRALPGMPSKGEMIAAVDKLRTEYLSAPPAAQAQSAATHG